MPGAPDILAGVSAATAPSAQSLLSPVAQAVTGALDTGVGAALGLSTSLSDASTAALSSAMSAVTDSLGDSISEIIGDVMDMVPIIGPMVKGAVSLVSMGLSLLSQQGETPSQECAQLFQAFKPQQTGSLLSGGLSVPADLFACVNPLALFWAGAGTSASALAADQKIWFQQQGTQSLPIGATGWVNQYGVNLAAPLPRRPYIAGPTKVRSALGMALMLVTEGTACDLDDFNWELVQNTAVTLCDASCSGEHDAQVKQIGNAKNVRALWEKALTRDQELAPKTWAKANPSDKPRGLPAEWITRFRHIRRGIEASYGPKLKSGTHTDGGAALWVAYVDLLKAAYDKGYLTDDYVTWLLWRQGSYTRETYSASLGTPKSNAAAAWHWLNEPLLAAQSDEFIISYGKITASPPTWLFFDNPCPGTVAQQIRSLVNSWRNTVNPYYQSGQAAAMNLVTQARVAGKLSGQQNPVDTSGSWIYLGAISLISVLAAGALVIRERSRSKARLALLQTRAPEEVLNPGREAFERVLTKGVEDGELERSTSPLGTMLYFHKAFSDGREYGITPTYIASKGKYFDTREPLPIRILVNPGGSLRLEDGRRRYMAAKAAGARSILADVVLVGPDGGAVETKRAAVKLL